MQQVAYPVQFSIDYPDRALDRLSTAFRIFAAIPILIVLGRSPEGPGSGAVATAKARPWRRGLGVSSSSDRC